MSKSLTQSARTTHLLYITNKIFKIIGLLVKFRLKFVYNSVNSHYRLITWIQEMSNTSLIILNIIEYSSKIFQFNKDKIIPHSP